MKVLCRHGHFAFFPRDESDISRFANYYNLTLVSENDYYTFPTLKGAPRYSLRLLPWVGLPATVTYEGQNPWDVMRENRFVFSLAFRTVVPVTSVITLIELPRSANYFLASTALIQPGSRLKTGQQILSYDGEYLPDSFKLKIRSFGFE